MPTPLRTEVQVHQGLLGVTAWPWSRGVELPGVDVHKAADETWTRTRTAADCSSSAEP